MSSHEIEGPPAVGWRRLAGGFGSVLAGQIAIIKSNGLGRIGAVIILFLRRRRDLRALAGPPRPLGDPARRGRQDRVHARAPASSSRSAPRSSRGTS